MGARSITSATPFTGRQKADLPSWLTRDVYVERVQPVLAHVAKTRIRSALGVSEPYSSAIQAGKRVPHPRHWEALAGLGGIRGRRRLVVHSRLLTGAGG